MLLIILGMVVGIIACLVFVEIRHRRTGKSTTVFLTPVMIVMGAFVGWLLAVDILPNNLIRRHNDVTSYLLETRTGSTDYFDVVLDHNDELNYVVYTRFETNGLRSQLAPESDTWIFDVLDEGEQPGLEVHHLNSCESGWWDLLIICSPDTRYTILLPEGSWTNPE